MAARETLAHRLGMTTHISPLLIKARGLGLTVPEDLWTLAVQRGCRHYRSGAEPAAELAESHNFSDEELALALLTVAAPYDPHSIRCGAAMLGSPRNKVETVVRLAILERSERVVRYVAKCGAEFEPQHPFWERLLNQLPETAPVAEGVLPHRTRFVTMSGYQRGVGPKIRTEWQRPAA